MHFDQKEIWSNMGGKERQKSLSIHCCKVWRLCLRVLVEATSRLLKYQTKQMLRRMKLQIYSSVFDQKEPLWKEILKK